MKRLRFAPILLLLAVLPLMSACEKSEKDTYLHITALSNTGYLDDEGEQLSVTVYASSTPTVTVSSTWIYLVSTSSDSDGYDYFAFTAEPNTDASQRTATITFTCDGLTARISVAQYAAGEGDDDEE